MIHPYFVNLVGKVKGHFKNKENRVAKLLAQWKELTNKLEGMIIRGNGTTLTSRLAYGSLLMMETGIRTGNESSSEGYVCDLVKRNKEGKIVWQHELYGKTIKTYGLTTILGEHVKLKKDKLILKFLGKKAGEQYLTTTNPILVRYCPTNKPNLWLDISYQDLRKFVTKYIGKGFTPKDLRTACVNHLFINLFTKDHLERYLNATRKSDKNGILSEAIGITADKIGHTKAVCRKSYLSSPLLKAIANFQYHQIRSTV